VINTPETKLLYFKTLSYADPAQFTLEFEKFIEKSLITTQKNKILIFLANKLKKAKPFEQNRAEGAAKTFIERVLREKDFIDYWNSSLNLQALWDTHESILPDQPIYFKTLLGGINDGLAYKLEKSYALRWEKKQKKREAAKKAKEAEQAGEDEEESESLDQEEKEEVKGVKFNLDYFYYVLNHKDFNLTPKNIIDMDIDKIRHAYISEE